MSFANNKNVIMFGHYFFIKNIGPLCKRYTHENKQCHGIVFTERIEPKV